MEDWVRVIQLYSNCKKALKDLPLKYEGVLVTLESRIRGEGREVVCSFVRSMTTTTTTLVTFFTSVTFYQLN